MSMSFSLRPALLCAALATFAATAALATPSPASAAPAGVSAVQYFSYRAAFAPNQALQIGISTPTGMSPYSSTDGGSHDWRKEPSTNGFRLHNRLLQELGAGDYCLTASGTSVFVELCAPNNNAFRQNWKLVKTGGIARLQHSNTLYLTYPASASGPVFLAGQGTATTQSFLENNEGFK
jgi:hypothetical protein